MPYWYCLFNFKMIKTLRKLRKNEVNQTKEIFEQYGSVIFAAVKYFGMTAINEENTEFANTRKRLLENFQQLYSKEKSR